MWYRKQAALLALLVSVLVSPQFIAARIPDRERVVKARGETSHAASKINSRVRHDGDASGYVAGSHRQHAQHKKQVDRSNRFLQAMDEVQTQKQLRQPNSNGAKERDLATTYTSCCSKYASYDSSSLCSLYGITCESGGSGDNNKNSDGSCTTSGLSFIGISFSVNTAKGNAYTYQLCDQFPMENIIDRDYEYIMSMDEDGWLVGGGYKPFDYSGKMPYIDSSHTELIRIGNMNPANGGTTIAQVYSAMAAVYLPPLSIYPEYLKAKAKNNNNKSGSSGSSNYVPSGDVTFIVSIVETYNEGGAYSDYEVFLNDIFSAMYAVGGGPCMDDHDTDPHVSMSRGVKFHSSYHMYQYMYKSNLEVAVWQAMYPKGVLIGSSGKAAFPQNSRASPAYIGYGNLYFFYDRANITKAFYASRDVTSTEKYYATLFTSSASSAISSFYEDTTYIPFEWNKQSGSNKNNNNGKSSSSWEHNPYNWKADLALHDMTGGWDLPPNCEQEGETFLGIPLSAKSSSKLQSTKTFQQQFNFDNIADYNYSYVNNFGTNHGWLMGDHIDNEVGSIVDKDTSHIPLFYIGTTNPDKGGLSLSNMIKVLKQVEFGTLYIKPAFVYADDNNNLFLQFEADSSSALGYLYSNLCQQLGISWNYNSPSNKYGLYTSCSMHSAGDRANYGCGPDNANSGGFCPRMAIAYKAKFSSSNGAATYLTNANAYVDYWRKLYPSGVAVGTSSFCKTGGCMGLFLNRMDLYQVFSPDLGSSWVEYNGGTVAPTISPAPTASGGCDNPANEHLDRCFRVKNRRSSKTHGWKNLGPIGQACVVLVTLMASTLEVNF
jgi:hypothetical protein